MFLKQISIPLSRFIDDETKIRPFTIAADMLLAMHFALDPYLYVLQHWTLVKSICLKPKNKKNANGGSTSVSRSSSMRTTYEVFSQQPLWLQYTTAELCCCTRVFGHDRIIIYNYIIYIPTYVTMIFYNYFSFLENYQRMCQWLLSDICICICIQIITRYIYLYTIIYKYIGICI